MKILIPLLGFGRAGGYRVLSKLADEFIKKGNQVDFLVPIFSKDPYFPTIANILWVDVKGKISNKNQPYNSGRFIKIMWCLYIGIKHIKRNKYDVVLVNHSLTAWPVYFAKIKAKIFYYIQAYEPEYYALLPTLKNKILKKLSRWSYKLKYIQIANSKIYCSYKEIKAKYVVCPGIDLELFYPKSSINKKQEGDQWKIGTIGRIEPQKGTQYILEAFKKLNIIRKDIIFFIAFGNEIMSKDLSNVKLIQPQNDAELAAFYKDIDIYISAGIVQHGAVHYPVMESLASGTSVITTPYHPANENNATLIEPNNAEAIVKAVIGIINNQEITFKKINKGIKDVKEFSWDIQAQKMLSIFNM